MRFQKRTLVLLGSLWLTVVGAGLFIMLNYETAPGVPGTSPVKWPADSQLAHSQERATLVMFGHPHCPCTRASIGELALLMARCQGKLEAKVIFVKAAGLPQDWEKSDIWRSAEAIPGVTVLCDNDGVEARRFRARTSGQTILYNAEGEMLFSGGITASRGHSGDNVGRSAIVSLLNGGVAQRSTTFVFGCSLFESDSK
jgi:hypothetical protein